MFQPLLGLLQAKIVTLSHHLACLILWKQSASETASVGVYDRHSTDTVRGKDTETLILIVDLPIVATVERSCHYPVPVSVHFFNL